MQARAGLSPASLLPKLRRVFELSAAKLRSLDQTWSPAEGSPVFTVDGRYTTRGWTEWTQGFQFGSAILQFDATGETEFLEIGRARTVSLMAPHLTHTGVHDHGFNNVSTYGNLLRLMHEGRLPENPWERRFYELALRCSGAVQAGRWSRIAAGGGYIYSFNGPHSLFVDTIRSARALVLAHSLGHVLLAENDRRISLLDRALDHCLATARYSVYYGEGRDAYDVRGRVAHECVFNLNDGNFRCPSTQQGYSPFTTWTRGLAWAMLGFAEQLEFLDSLEPPSAALPLARARRPRHLRFLPRQHPSRWHPLLGHRRSRPGKSRRLARRPRRPLPCRRARRQLRRRHRRPGIAAPGPPPRRRPLLAGRPLHRRHALCRPVPCHRSRAPGPASAFRLPPPQRLELAARRILHVGRLPRPRARPLPSPPGRRRAVPEVLAVGQTIVFGGLPTVGRAAGLSDRSLTVAAPDGATSVSEWCSKGRVSIPFGAAAARYR